MSEVVLVMNGRGAGRVLKGARKKFPEREMLVISHDGDMLPAPGWVRSIPVCHFIPEAGTSYEMVTNGGTTDQLVGVIRALVEAGAEFRAIDLQRDGLCVLWDYSGGKPSGRLTEAEALYHNTAW